VVPDLADPHYPHIAVGVEDAAREAELAVLICNTLGETSRLTEYLGLLQARRVDAIVLSGATSLDAVELQALQDCEVPLVLIGRPAIEAPWPHVSIDNRDGARQATRHLREIGRTHIVHLGGPCTQTTMADRALGYADALSGQSAEFIASNGTPDDGYRQLARRFDEPGAGLPDGVFAATDRLAIAALALASDRGLRVPGDLAIVGFDDLPLGEHLRPSLSSVAQPAHRLGTVAVDMAQRLAAGEPVQPVLLPARLVPRQSTLGQGPN
jgi:LacI family transcriptional regulator